MVLGEGHQNHGGLGSTTGNQKEIEEGKAIFSYYEDDSGSCEE